DSEVSWFDWSLVRTHAGLHRFVSLLNGRRLLRNIEDGRLSLDEFLRGATFAWHGTALGRPDWSEASRSIALSVQLQRERVLLHIILNAFWEPLEFELPAGAWHRWIDTALESPNDIAPWREGPAIPGSRYSAGARSVAVLLAPLQPGAGVV